MWMSTKHGEYWDLKLILPQQQINQTISFLLRCNDSRGTQLPSIMFWTKELLQNCFPILQYPFILEYYCWQMPLPQRCGICFTSLPSHAESKGQMSSAKTKASLDGNRHKKNTAGKRYNKSKLAKSHSMPNKSQGFKHGFYSSSIPLSFEYPNLHNTTTSSNELSHLFTALSPNIFCCARNNDIHRLQTSSSRSCQETFPIVGNFKRYVQTETILQYIYILQKLELPTNKQNSLPVHQDAND